MCAGALLSLGAAQPVAGQDTMESTFVLGTVEVIGEKESIVAPLVTDAVRADVLENLHRNDLAEALDLIPGVTVQNLGQRRERLISVRGFSSRQVPLFIDGVPVYVPYDGNVDLARFGVDYVSEVVVGKGLASLLYGPNILGGAVNVISRKPTQPVEISAKLTTELDDDFNSIDRRAVTSLGGTNGTWYGHVTASFTDSDGYRLPGDFVPVAAEDGGNRENAQSKDRVVTAKIGYAPSDAHELALSYYRQDGEKQDPPYSGSYLRTNARTDGVQVRFWRWPYWDKESIYLVGRSAISPKATLRWRVFHDSFKNALESFDDATYTTQTRPYAFHGSNYDDYTYGGNADLEWAWSDAHTSRIAMHYRQDVHRESQLAPALPQQRLEIPTYDVAFEHEWRLTGALTLAGSYSHMRQPEETVQVYNSGTRTFAPVSTDEADADNIQLIATYRLDDANSFVAGASRKTRFPTLKERFSGGLGSAVPNPGLDPETAVHYEIGFQHSGETWGAKAALFHSELDDAIQSVTLLPTRCSSPPCTQLQNIGEQRNLGLELAAHYAPVSALLLNGQINVLDVENQTHPAVRPTGLPKYKYIMSGDWEFIEQWRLRVHAQHESKRYSNSTGTRIADSFTLLNAFVRFTPAQHLGAELGVRNATGELYEYEEGFFEAGRTWLGQLDYRF